jgi:4'-phosphopantetheinyl transferase
MSPNAVDVWRIGLAVPEREVLRCRQLLSSDEAERADRFYFQEHRWRFTVARAAMREILGKYAHVPPQDLIFSYGAKGKPDLSGLLKESGITFNLSHSKEYALLAVARGLNVGVDIEAVNHEFASEEIAERFFSASEVDRLRALCANERADGFFSCWTRKEAYIKALGEGLSVPLDSFEVAFGPGVPAALLHVKIDSGEASRWSMYDIEVWEGYKAALVAEGKGHGLRHLQWERIG